MNYLLETKVEATIKRLRAVWRKTNGKSRFVAFSTGKDSLLLAALLYEAVAPERPPCLYVHHELEYPDNLTYLGKLTEFGFRVEVLRPHLEYFDLMERGMGFITLRDAWCIPMLIGTAIFDWLACHNIRSCRNAIMFRGMSGSEYSCKLHRFTEIYGKLDIPCVNPLLDYSRQEILTVLSERYSLPLNPIYSHMDRTYCICCYAGDTRHQVYGKTRFPEAVEKYYGQINALLFESGLMERHPGPAEHKTREEKLYRHGFVHWRRAKAQDSIGAIKTKSAAGVLRYIVRNPNWIDPKHLIPLKGHWERRGTEIRLWGVSEKHADAVIKRMINCLDCGYCMVECLRCRRFDHKKKALAIEGCIGCGKCLRLKYCMGWRHRFWRRTIQEQTDEQAAPTKRATVSVSDGAVQGIPTASTD